MRPIRLALPLLLLLASELAGAGGPVPPSAIDAARDTEALLAKARFEEAIAHFRRSVETAPPDAAAAAAANLHAFVLGYYLIRAGRLASAEAELAWFAARPRPEQSSAQADAHGLLRLIDLQLYLAAGRGDSARVLALLDARGAFAGSLHSGCPADRYFPEVVAPTHHDPRVAARLRALGCPQSIIDQLDEIASRPIGANVFDPGLPPRPPR